MLAASLATSFLLNSCSNNSENNQETTQANTNIVSEGSKDSLGQVVYSLPAPMQIASAIKRNCPNYFDDLLCPLKSSATSNFAKTINLGIYAVDLGYANVYEKTQTSINYFAASIKLADELKIMGPVNPALLNVFKENVNNKDSVKHYTLHSFADIHDNLITSNRKDEAMLILTGSFIEGVYISSQIQGKNKDKNLAHLVGEQKLFLESLLDLLPANTDKKDLNTLVASLNELKTIYDKVEIKYKDEASDPNQKNMEPIAISDDVLKEINSKITLIRNSIILNSATS